MSESEKKVVPFSVEKDEGASREMEGIKEVAVRETTLFELKASDQILRELMYFLQQEGIIAQKTESESRVPDSKDRRLNIWVDKEDEEKIKQWLSSNGFSI